MGSGRDGGAGERATLTRCAVVWLTGTLLLLLLLAWLGPDLPLVGEPRVDTTRSAPAGPSFDLVLVRASALVASLVAGWLWLMATTVAVLAASGRHPSRVPGLPRFWRRLVLAACGVALATGAPALAGPKVDPAPVAVRPDDRTHARDVAVLAGLPYPDRAGPDRTPLGDRSDCPARGTIVVRTGDTLWELARRQLAPGADDAAVTRAWHRLYARNRAVVGADPDLIHPHLRLRVPCR